MRRILALLVFFGFGFAPAPPPRNGATPTHLAGKWVVNFANGVVETCELHRNGTASVVEPARSSAGTLHTNGTTVVVTFADDRVERWTVSGSSVAVEHWFPASRYPTGPSVRGTARRSR